MSTCSDCNWFSTRESYCSKKKRHANHDDEACSDAWLIIRPVPPIEEDKEHFNICSDCLEKGYSLFNDFKYCPICGKELEG